MDTILLALLKKALACPVRYGRIIAGGVLGAVVTCVVVIWPCKTTWAKFIVFHGVINVLMLRTGLGLKWGRELFRGWVILYIESFLLGGVLQFAGQYLRQGSVFFALAVISYYVVLGIWKIIYCFRRKEIVTVKWWCFRRTKLQTESPYRYRKYIEGYSE